MRSYRGWISPIRGEQKITTGITTPPLSPLQPTIIITAIRITTPLQPTIITAMAMLPAKSRYFNLSLIIFQPDCRSYKGLYFLLHHLVMFDTTAMIIFNVLAVIFVMIRVVMISYMCDPLRWSPG